MLVKTLKLLQEDEEFANAIDPHLGLPNKHAIPLKIIANRDQSQLLPYDIKIVQWFLKSIQGDMELNKKLLQLQIKSGLSKSMQNAIGSLITYTYKTRHLSTFSKTFKKLKDNSANVQAGKPSVESDKISLPEYASAHDIAKIAPFMDLLANTGLLGNDSELNALRENAKKTSEIMQQMEVDFRSTRLDSPGTIVFDDTQKKSAVYDKAPSFFDTVANWFVTKYNHASKMFTNQQNKSTLSHANIERTATNEFSMREYLYADIYKIKIEALIPQEQQKSLRLALGENWQQTVNALYANIEREIHDNTVQRFSKVNTSVSWWRHIKTALYNCIPFGIGYKKFSTNDFNKIHQQVFGEFYKKGDHRLMCSEFVAHTTIAALVKLDAHLKEVLEQYNKKMEKQNKTQITIPTDRLVTIPFGEHEDLELMHPERLLQVLQEHHCVEKANAVPKAVMSWMSQSQTTPEPPEEKSKPKSPAT